MGLQRVGHDWATFTLFHFSLPMPCKIIEIIIVKPVNPKGNQPWIFIGRTDAEAQAPILWPPDAKSWLKRKDPDTGQGWGQEKRVTEDAMVGEHHQLNGYECEQTLGDDEGQGSAACYSPWGYKELDTTERLSLYFTFHYLCLVK